MPRTIFFLLLLASSALAQQTCPRGLTNDSLPGKCGLYTDADGNNVCDLSETAPVQDPGSGSEETGYGDTSQESQSQPPETEDPGTNQPTEPLQNGETETCDSGLGINPGPDPKQLPAPATPPRRANNHFWEIFIFTGILGLASELWLKKNPKDTQSLQIIWNWLLLLSFLGSALSGLYFVLPFDKRPALGFNFSYWHTVVSIAFIAIGLYHTIRRFACLLGRPGPCLKIGACQETKKRPK